MTLSDCIGKGKIFEGAIIINMKSRADRRARSTVELTKVGALQSVEWMDAIEHPYGMVGCSLSHLECVKLAKQRGWKSVIIFEDDIIFKEYFNQCLEPTIKQLEQRNWSVFHFGAMLMNICNLVSPNLMRIGYNWAAHAIAIHGRAYDYIINNYDWSYSKTDSSKPWGGHYPFDGFVNKNVYDAGFEIYSAYPCLITQHANHSDTWGMHRDYLNLIEESYDKQITREVNVLVCSKNRPMQLKALLESYHHYNRQKGDDDFATVNVLYVADSQFVNAYESLKKEYPRVQFRAQRDFARDVLEITSTRPFAMFLVDDAVFHRPFSLGDGVTELCSSPDIFSFSYRLGENTQYSYINNIPFATPKEYIGATRIARVDWTQQDPYIDFGYPFEISSSLYRTEDVRKIFGLGGMVGFDAPNYMELTGTTIVRNNKDKFGTKIATYRRSVAVCVPMNRVQNLHLNRCGTNPLYSPEQLLAQFEAGMVFDLSKMNENWMSNSVHVEINLPLKHRS